MLEKLNEFQLSKLPHWVLTDSQPAFYDTESATAIQQTSKLYAKMQELITTYNEFINKVNTYIDDFENGIIENFDCFKKCIIETMNDYIQSIDQKIELQNLEIANAKQYMQDNLISTINDLFMQAIKRGDIQNKLKEDYHTETEELNLSIIAEGGE